MIISRASNFKFIDRLCHELTVNLLVYCSTLVVLFALFNIIPNYIDNIYAYASNETNRNSEVPNIDAKSIYDTGTAILGNNVKNLIILIPDEAHHGNGEPKENRFIVQSFLPQTAVIDKGTKVVWFSGDVSHEHTIELTDRSNPVNSKSLFDSGEMAENTESNPMIFNKTGNYGYISPNIDQEAVQKGFVMKGDVVVIDQQNKLFPSKISYNSNSSKQPTSSDDPKSTLSSTGLNNKDIQTIGVYMVPTKELKSYISDFQKKGFSIDSTHTFKDVRGIARGTNSEQTLLVWTAGPDLSLDNIISALKEITPTLPYK